MKKILCIMLAAAVCVSLFVSCGNSNEQEFIETITYEKIAQVNSITNLLKNYERISERTTNLDMDDGGDFSWELSYEKNGDSINAIVDTGDQYRCFYYNGKIFASYNNVYLPVLYFRETYSDIVSETIKRENLLNSVYHTISSREVLNDGRYVITFDFKATPEMLNDFESWNVKTGQKMQLVYYLKENLEIDHYDYYILDGNDKAKKIAAVNFNYDSGFEFPEEVIKLAETKDTCTVTLYENYGLGSQYSESYEVPKGLNLEINSYLYAYNIYTDPELKNLWSFENSIINKDTKLYLNENIFYEIDEESGDTIITREESQNE